MSVRSWAVGVVSTAAVVTGVVAVQSGIPGATALPILPHRAVAPAAPTGGAELPAPAEISAPPPSAGAVTPVDRAGVAPERRSAADRPEKRAQESGKDSDKKSGKGSKHDRPDKGPDADGAKGKD
jgi:hypothetical protein